MYIHIYFIYIYSCKTWSLVHIITYYNIVPYQKFSCNFVYQVCILIRYFFSYLGICNKKQPPMLELIILKYLTSQKISHNKFKFHYIFMYPLNEVINHQAHSQLPVLPQLYLNEQLAPHLHLLTSKQYYIAIDSVLVCELSLSISLVAHPHTKHG